MKNVQSLLRTRLSHISLQDILIIYLIQEWPKSFCPENLLAVHFIHIAASRPAIRVLCRTSLAGLFYRIIRSPYFIENILCIWNFFLFPDVELGFMAFLGIQNRFFYNASHTNDKFPVMIIGGLFFGAGISFFPLARFFSLFYEFRFLCGVFPLFKLARGTEFLLSHF